jgi:ABC-type Zn uptake system ZnuABC Zn-binding protein ZnuA
MMESFQNRRIVIQHRSWIYFTHRFGIEVVAELEPKPGIPPSAPHLQDVIRTVEAEGVKVILLEPFYGRKPADFVAGKTGARVVVCANSVGGDPEAADYLSLIDLIASRLGEAF